MRSHQSCRETGRPIPSQALPERKVVRGRSIRNRAGVKTRANMGLVRETRKMSKERKKMRGEKGKCCERKVDGAPGRKGSGD